MKTKILNVFLFIGITSLFIGGCAFLRGTGSTTTDSGALCLDYKNSEKSSLDKDLVDEMTRLYQTTQGLNENHVKAIRFDLETLKKFIYHIELAAKKQNKSSKDLGIRIYYARYPKLASWSDPNLFQKDLSGFLGNPITKKYVGKHTLIMIPTENIGGVHHDYNPLATNLTFQNNILRKKIDISKDIKTQENPRITALMPQNSNNLRQNHGELYPPYSEDGMDFVHN